MNILKAIKTLFVSEPLELYTCKCGFSSTYFRGVKQHVTKKRKQGKVKSHGIVIG